MALIKWKDFVAAHPDKALMATPIIMTTKGNGSSDIFLIECDPASGTLLTTGSGIGTAAVKWKDFVIANFSGALSAMPAFLLTKSNASNDLYLIEIDEASGELKTT